MKNTRLFVITGPSGAGISDIIAAVIDSRTDIGNAIPVTARKMKSGEVNGVGYYFYDLEGWEELKQQGDLLETTVFAGNDYGTSRRVVNEQLAQGKNVILLLEAERAARIRENMPEAVCIYIAPSTEEKLRSIYEKTARHPIEVDVRLEEARRRKALCSFCDETVVSDDFDAAVKRLNEIIG